MGKIKHRAKHTLLGVHAVLIRAVELFAHAHSLLGFAHLPSSSIFHLLTTENGKAQSIICRSVFFSHQTLYFVTKLLLYCADLFSSMSSFKCTYNVLRFYPIVC